MRIIEELNNPFYSPFEGNVLIKGVEEDGRWVVYLEASNELRDQEDEVVEMNALKKASDYYLSHGILSYDHKHKLTNDPKFIIGEPLEVKFTPDNRTLVKGFLYKENDIAKSLWKNILSKAKKLGASIGGGILQKAHSRISRVIWDETAITPKPVNDGTLGKVQIVPFAEFAKALMAGSGVNAANFTGGRALIGESLQGSKVDSFPPIPREDMRTFFSDLLKSIRRENIQNYNDLLNFVLDRGYDNYMASQLVHYVARKIPLVVDKLR